MPEASACILSILLRCGMIAREEQEIVRGLLLAPLRGPTRAAAQPKAR